MSGKKSTISKFTISGRCFVLLLFAGWMLSGSSCRPAVSHEKESLRDRRIEKAFHTIAAALPLLKDGDLVLRTGSDFTSLTLRQFSYRDKTYSHCGIVHFEQGIPFIYHAIGGEDNPDEHLRRDRFEDFCDPVHNTGFGIYRYDISKKDLHRLDSIVVSWYRQRLPFDMKFDLNTDNRMYCAEFIYKSLSQATGIRDFLPLSHFGRFYYVAIDNLFLNPHAREISRVQYAR